MAEGKTLAELEREITCSICQEHYTEPKILPCLHYYCKQCVLRLATRTATGQPFSCPECRSKATLPKGGVDELKTAFNINRLKAIVLRMEQTHGKIEVKCESCSDPEGKAEAFCRQCAMFICKRCSEHHKKLKVFLSHEVSSLKDLKEGRSPPMMLKEPLTKLCVKHDEPLFIYCFLCESLICQQCTLKDHRDHNFEFSKIAAPTTKGKLLKDLKPLKDHREGLDQAILGIHSTKKDIEAQGKDVAASIQSSFQKLREILDKREQELLQEAAANVRRKMDKLSAQEKYLCVASAQIKRVVDYTEQCVRHGSDNEVMSMHTEIRRQIDVKIKEHSCKERQSLEPEEEADIGIEVSCAEALKQLCQTHASIFQLPIDPAKCTCEVQLAETPEVGKVLRCTLSLIPRLSNNKTTRRQVNVTSSLQCKHKEFIAPCVVGQTGIGQYLIQYTPTLRGRHELSVSVDGQLMVPFPVFVSVNPCQLGRPVKVWNNVMEPTGITINSVGEIFVSELRGDILKFDLKGNRTTLSSQRQVTELRKIEVDKANNIYCISERSNSVLRCDQDGSNVRMQDIKHVRNGCWGLAIVDEELIISGRDNSGTMVVYDRELSYERCIKRTNGDITAISVDNHGNIYCADWTIGLVQVFSNDGVLLRSFECDEKGKKKVKKPWGLCVSGHYVYVCNSGFHNISVFTTDGLHMASFGQRGSSEGDFDLPLSICADEDGFVYVVDYKNNRVQCF